MVGICRMWHRLLCFLLLAFLMLLPHGLLAQIKVDTLVDSQQAWEEHQLRVEVLVTHPSNKIVDIGSFRYENRSIRVELVKEEKIGFDELVSIYAFQLPGKPAGLYWLSPVEVSVHGVVYRSVPVSYDVVSTSPSRESGNKKIRPSAGAGSAGAGSAGATAVRTNSKPLSLQAYVDAPMPIFPGQRVRLVYRYLFSSNIDLTEEELPMLEAKGLKKIGDIQVQEIQRNKVSIHEISQQVEAEEPGEYVYGPSYVEGFAYAPGAFGQKVYMQPKLRGEAPEVVVTVIALPKEGKVTGFKGAIGQFSIKSELLSSSRIAVGDVIRIVVTISGKGEMSSVELPELLCQPGFSGLFQLSNRPIVGALTDEGKRFDLELRPLSGQVVEVPAIAFTYFNPESRVYEVASSSPLSLEVRAAKLPAAQPPPAALQP